MQLHLSAAFTPRKKGTARSERLSGRTGILPYWDPNIGRSVLTTEKGRTVQRVW